MAIYLHWVWGTQPLGYLGQSMGQSDGCIMVYMLLLFEFFLLLFWHYKYVFFCFSLGFWCLVLHVTSKDTLARWTS